MSGLNLYHDPDERLEEFEEHEEELERREEPFEERGHGERAGSDDAVPGAHEVGPDSPRGTRPPEPEATNEEGAEDNDGGPPTG